MGDRLSVHSSRTRAPRPPGSRRIERIRLVRLAVDGPRIFNVPGDNVGRAWGQPEMGVTPERRSATAPRTVPASVRKHGSELPETLMIRLEFRKQILGLAAWLVVVFAASAVGAAASVRAGSFYGQLVLPPWAPPGQVFGPVWTLLYALMGISAWFVWRSGGIRANRIALAFFIGQLALNALWSWLFFGWHLGGWAFADILLLIATISVTLVLFWRVRTIAGALLIPYLLWVLFAAALNYTVWQLNPGTLG